MSDSVFDLKALSDRVAGRQDVVDELIQMLRASFPDDRRELVDRLNSGDAAGAREIAHRIKGQLQTLGLRRAAGRARDIEQLSREGALERATAALADLEHEFQRFEALSDARSQIGNP